MFKVIVTDKLAQEGLDYLASQDDIEVVVKTNFTEDELADAIGEYDGLIIRSGTQVTAKVLAKSGKLKAIARAGVGIDNVDVKVATEKGIVVMNTPDGNTISAAEHTIAMMMALSRHIVGGNNTLKAGTWDRKNFMGTQLMGKTLGVVGLGRIGLSVARRAMGLKMKVVGFDPLASAEAVTNEGIEYIADVKDVFRKSDFITLHVPVTDQTRGMVNAQMLSLMKPTARLVNVARGAVIVENDLWDALKEKKIAGAALDVFSKEPPDNRGFETLDNCLVTPHLGASTEEAQIEVAIDAAKELVDALRGIQMRNAVNVPGQDKAMPEIVMQYKGLANKLGNIAGNLSKGKIEKIELSFAGELAEYAVGAITTSCLAGVLQPMFEGSVNDVNARSLAEKAGLSIAETKNSDSNQYSSSVAVSVTTAGGNKRTVTGTIIGKGIEKIIAIDNVSLEITPEGSIVAMFYDDRPGVIGIVGTLCGKNGINIGTMGVGRENGKAILAVSLDQAPTESILKELATNGFTDVYICNLK